MANVNIELGYKNLAWFNANPTIVLLEGQIVYLEQTGTYKIGDGISALSTLSFLGVSSETQTLQNVTDLGNTTTNSIDTAGITTDYVQLDLTAINTGGVGKMIWNDVDGTIDIGLKGGNVTLQVGQEFLARVVNKTATNISLLEANYQAVRITGAQGQRPKVDLALANNDLNSATTLGLVTETIVNNAEGFITTSGQVREINTTGSLQGETWNDGDTLYLSGTIAGQITNIKPSAPTHTIIIGFVEYAHAVHGKIFVKVNNGYELEELHNVSAIAPNNNEVLTYETSTTLWKPKTVISALGYTPYNSTNPSSYISGITSGMITTALGFTPYNSTNPSGYITEITSGMVTTALGYTPYNSTNPSGYITSSALTPYAQIDNPTFTTAITTPVINGVSSLVQFNSAHNINIGNANTTGQRILRAGQGTGWVDIGNASDSTGIGFISFNQTTNTLANSALYGGAFSTVLNSNNVVYIRLGNGNQIAVNITNHVFTPSSASSGAITPFTFTVPANTGQTLSTNIPNFKVTGASKTFATGALATQYFNYFSANTLAFVGASTATEVFTAYFDKTTVGTNATITRNFSAGFGGDVKVVGNITTWVDGGINLYNSNGTQFIGSILRGNDASLGIEASLVDLNLGAGGLAGNVNIYNSNATKSVRIKTTIGVYIGTNLTTTPTARLHIQAGTATAGTAPLKLTAGTNLTAVENGAFEYDGTNLYFTTGGVRKMVTLI